ncbi:cadherin-87A isoform X2 [Chironomus tepperi]
MSQHTRNLLLLLTAALFAIRNSSGNVNLPPIFTQDMNNLALSEMTPLDSIVYRLEGYDPEGGNVTFGLIGSENFQVDAVTGDVKLVKELDRETHETLSFLVSIKDKVNESGDSDNDNFVQVPISVIVLDENDNAPEFQNVPYETTVLEDAAIGTTVFDKILITDRDAVGENLDVICVHVTKDDSHHEHEQHHQNPCITFSIDVLESHQDRMRAAVVLKQKLDYNENIIFNIQLLSTDGLHNASSNMIIHVEDVQNSPPIFQGSLATIINEDSPIGTLVLTIQAKDGDRGSSRKIYYDIITNPMDYFLIDSITGELRTGKPLDKEELPDASGIVTLVVRAREIVDGIPSNDPTASTTTKVSITIRDVNDVAPTFNQKEYYVTIPENTAVGTPLPVEIIVNDPDVGQNSVFSLRLDDVSEVFDIEPKQVIGTSQISIRVANGSLDYENVNQRKFIVLIVAEETLTNPKLSSTATLTVSLTDVNDNFPHFEQDTYTATVSETAPAGQLITIITASDMDSGVFGDQGIRYSILNGTGAELFNVDPLTGTITVADCPVDDGNGRKKRQLEYHSQHIKKVNITHPGEYGILSVVDDANDFNYEHTTMSNDYVTYHVESYDDNETIQKDKDVYSLGKYPCLDYETQTDYYLNYQATDNDGKGQMSVASLRISVIDANDNPPKCESSIYRATLDEGAMTFDGNGLTVKARDEDVLSEITYQIIGTDVVLKSFKIDKRTGQLSIKKGASLDVNHLNGESIVFSVEASDGLYSTLCDVNITLRDVNNHAPVFSRKHYVASIEENLPIGTKVEEMNATDLDTGENAEIIYQIQHGSFNDFTIDNRTGIITIAKPLDYDIRQKYTLEIVASDKGIPSLSGTATVEINIINSNDKAPYFIPTTQRAEISEDAEIDTFVHKLTANDPDIVSIDLLDYTWDESATTAVSEDGTEVPASHMFSEYFAINKTGVVTVNKKLRRDLFAVIRLTVFVTDTTAPVLQQGKGLLIITVIDINEHPPVFQSPTFNFDVMEEQPVNTILATLHATDADSTISEYQLIDGSGDNGNEYFEINNVTGLIRTKSRIDYENVKLIKFNVTVTDTGVPQLTSTAQIFVNVININDNTPQFNETEYQLNVNENAIKGTSIGFVHAHDADEGEFGVLKYALIGEQSQHFEIDENTGEIFVANTTALDREKQSEIMLSVVAIDQGLPIDERRSTTSNVNIKVWDENDESPTFRQHSYYASIAENLQLNPPATILQVQADDKDEDEAGTVKYTILSGNDDNSFMLDANSGILYPATSLMGRKGQYKIKVEARDGVGFGPHTDIAEIIIDVIEVNQHRPMFIMPALSNATVEIQESLAIKDYLVLTVKAEDPDNGDNGKISYHLQVNNENVQETDTFEINSINGELRLRKQLNKKELSRYEIILVARDHGIPTNFQQLRFLTILLVDNNEGNPEFPDASNPYKFYVTENGERDERIGKIQAIVHDSGREKENHAIYYYILLGNDDGAFYIDKITGDVFTNKSLDREMVDMYVLYVLASKKSDLHISDTEQMFLSTENLERNSTVAKVWIHVLDVNDCAPEFAQNIYYAGVNKKSGMNELIAIINATDKDFGVNASIEYLIAASHLYKFGASKSTGNIVPSPFSISQDGRLTTNAYMAEYNQDRFELDIQAKEVQPPERIAVAKVFVWIYEPEQLVRVILSRPPSEVQNERDEILVELTNVTKKHIIIDDVRYHVDSIGRIRMDWTDLFFHAVDMTTKSIVPVYDILNEIDSKYDFLKDYYSGFAIENVIPAYTTNLQEEFDIALAAIIALLIVLFVGAISFIVLCCCLKNWVISIPSETRRKDALIKKQIIDDLNTTENPLWIEQKLKIYEEQELTMKIFAEPSEFQLPLTENSSMRQHSSNISHNLLGMETPPTPLLDTYNGSDAGGDFDTNYATILNYSNSNNNNSGSCSTSNNNNSSALVNNSRSTNNTINLIDADYQTLRTTPRVPSLFEFNGSTFQVQRNENSSDYTG